MMNNKLLTLCHSVIRIDHLEGNSVVWFDQAFMKPPKIGQVFGLRATLVPSATYGWPANPNAD